MFMLFRWVYPANTGGEMRHASWSICVGERILGLSKESRHVRGERGGIARVELAAGVRRIPDKM